MKPPARRLNIALAMSSFFPVVGGAQVTANNLGRYLTDRGHNVVAFVSPKYWRALGSRRAEFPFKILPMFPAQQSAVPRFGEPYLKLQDLYLGFMQWRYKFDVWQSFGAYPTGVSIGHFAHRRNIPHVVRTVGYDIQKDEQIGYGYRLNPKLDGLIKRWTPGVSKAIALTESVVSDLVDIGVSMDDITIVPCGVNYNRFTEGTFDRDRVRESHGIPRGVFTYITVGRNHPKKGFPVLVKALAGLKSLLPDTKFHCVFVGRDMDQLEPLARSLDLVDNVTFIDEVGSSPEDDAYEVPSSPLIRLYRSMDACVFPSLIEAHSHINIEAMAAGLPVISTNAPGVRDTVVDGVDGLLATAGDPESLAEKMAEIQTNSDRREQLVAQGHKSARNKYDWSVVGKQFEDLYLELVQL
ncbi:MAG: glycosyltransferase family 4 protein [Chloroflexi bacterium]|nr:glycosyltransferase family 4 protein [Chloroflexota bacterium]